MLQVCSRGALTSMGTWYFVEPHPTVTQAPTPAHQMDGMCLYQDSVRRATENRLKGGGSPEDPSPGGPGTTKRGRWTAVRHWWTLSARFGKLLSRASFREFQRPQGLAWPGQSPRSRHAGCTDHEGERG